MRLRASGSRALRALCVGALLTACSGGSEPASGGADASGTPSPTDSEEDEDATPASDASEAPDTMTEPDTVTLSDTAAVSDTVHDTLTASDAWPDGETVADTDAAVVDVSSQPDVPAEPDAIASEDPDVAAEDVGPDDPGTPCISGGLPPCPDGAYCDPGGCGLNLEGVCVPKPLDCAPGGEAVCACDGNFYANACFARQAGQRPIGAAPCPATEWNCEVDTTGWGFGTGCSTNEYCFGGCVGEGFCKERPVCDEGDWDLKCACTGYDYGNSCTLASAGKNLDHEGLCGDEPNYGALEQCGGPDSDVCSDESAFCDLHGCEADSPGLCVNIWIPGTTDEGELCLPGSPQECGCDGVTYTHKCARVLAGAALNHQGACGAGTCELALATGGEAGQCGTGLHCEAPIGQCDGEGECSETSMLCGLIPGGDIPVCGCDGTTFESQCHAQQADMPVAAWGGCDG